LPPSLQLARTVEHVVNEQKRLHYRHPSFAPAEWPVRPAARSDGQAGPEHPACAKGAHRAVKREPLLPSPE
jgi:hypothetical protein